MDGVDWYAVVIGSGDVSGLPDDQLEKELREAVHAVWLRRKEHVIGRVDVLSNTVGLLLDGSITEEDLAGARTEAHKLAGALGSFGFGRGSDIAERIEGLISESESAIRSAELISELVADLRNELSS